jgi:transcriptional regulator GlxA family with amidase domain
VTSKIPLRNERGRIVGTAGVTREAQDHTRLNGIADSPLSAAIHYISQHYGDRISNVELAKISGLSMSALHRQFLSAYKCSPHTYIRQLRIRMSCNTLVYSRKSIALIATEFGFADQSHFTREFSRVMAETPSSYRAHYQG